MAVMGSKKQMVRRIIENRRASERELTEKQKKKLEEESKPITEEEHKKRVQMLREMGLLKE